MCVMEYVRPPYTPALAEERLQLILMTGNRFQPQLDEPLLLKKRITFFLIVDLYYKEKYSIIIIF